MNKTIFKVECLKAISIHNHIIINNSNKQNVGNLCCALKRFTIVKWDKNEWKIGI